MTVSTDAIRDWFTHVIAAWRAAFALADAGTQRRARVDLYNLEGPVQIAVVVVRADSLVAAGVLVEHNPARSDGEIRVADTPDDAPLSADSPCDEWVARKNRELMAIMRGNWTPGRAQEVPTMPLHAQRVGRKSSTVAWWVPGDITQIDINAFVAWCFRERASSTTASSPAPGDTTDLVSGPHAFEAGMRREAFALARWLAGPGRDDLFRQLGLPGNWWCGLGLKRASVFGERLDGDVDLIAGPLEFEMTPDELHARIEAEKVRWPLETHVSNITSAALDRLVAEGRLAWPPRTDRVVACEVKASWYEPMTETVKCSHENEGERIKGQLAILLKRGVDRVAFLHLITTRPLDSPPINPWFQAAGDAEDAHDRLEPLFPLSDRPTCGYLTAAIGAVGHKIEEFSGATGELRVHQPPMANSGARLPWRDHLRAMLARLPKPRCWRVFVLPCARCDDWGLHSSPTGTIACGCEWSAG